MKLDDLLNIDIKNLSQAQYEALKKHTIDKLNDIIKLLKEDKLQDVADLLEFSCSGDGWGNDNYYINFSYNDTETMDIADILYKLAELKNIKINLDWNMR